MRAPSIVMVAALAFSSTGAAAAPTRSVSSTFVVSTFVADRCSIRVDATMAAHVVCSSGARADLAGASLQGVSGGVAPIRIVRSAPTAGSVVVTLVF